MDGIELPSVEVALSEASIGCSRASLVNRRPL
jgi:hypothetical protein